MSQSPKSLSRSARIFAALIMIGSALNLLVAIYSLRQLKIGGPIYAAVIDNKDLVADILPPPEYLIEAFLEANLAVYRPGDLAMRRGRLEQLRKDYDDRHAYWMGRDLPENLRAPIAGEVETTARAFWSLSFERLLPALERGDRDAAARDFEQLSEIYTRHRAAIDQLVAAANRQTEEIERLAAARDRLFSALLSIAAIVALALTGVAYVAVARFVVAPIAALAEAMRRLAAGDQKIVAPCVARADEIGEMGRALEVFIANDAERLRLADSERETRSRENARQELLAERVKGFSAEIGVALEALGGQTDALRGASRRFSGETAEVEAQAEAAAVATGAAAENARAVAQTTVEMEASIREIASRAASARDLVDNAAKAAETADAVVAIGALSGHMAAIRELTQGIALSVDQQQLATRDIAANVSGAAQSSESAAGNVDRLRLRAEAARAESAQLSSCSDQLSEATGMISTAACNFAALVRDDLTERRRAWRQSAKVAVSIERAGARSRAMVEDISLSGLRLSGVACRRGESVRIEIDGAWVGARVVWAEGDSAGLAFDRAFAETPRLAA